MKNLFTFICGLSATGIAAIAVSKANAGLGIDSTEVVRILALAVVAVISGYGVWKLDDKDRTNNATIKAIADKLQISKDEIAKYR